MRCTDERRVRSQLCLVIQKPILPVPKTRPLKCYLIPHAEMGTTQKHKTYTKYEMPKDRKKRNEKAVRVRRSQGKTDSNFSKTGRVT